MPICVMIIYGPSGTAGQGRVAVTETALPTILTYFLSGPRRKQLPTPALDYIAGKW